MKLRYINSFRFRLFNLF